MRNAAGHVLAAVLAAGAIVLAGCDSGGGGNSGSEVKDDSPIINEDVPAMDIANLPDIEATRTQMLDLIERVRAEVTRLVPASEPWAWNREESTSGCKQEGTGRKGVALYFANLVSEHAFTDAEWDRALPVVQRLADEAGLSGESEMQNSKGNHDVRFFSDDGRTLLFGSEAATVISATIACRRAAEG